MNKLGHAFHNLFQAETDLTDEYHAVADRQAAEHDIYTSCSSLATQNKEHVAWIQSAASSHDIKIVEHSLADALPNILGTLLQKSSEL